MNDRIESQLADLGRNLPAPEPEVTRRARSAVLGATPRRHRPLLRLLPTAATIAVAAVAVLALLIVAPNGNHESPVAESERVGTGPSLVIPEGWSGTSGAYRVPCCAGSNRVVRVTNAPTIPGFTADQDGTKAAAALRARQVIIEVTTYPPDRRNTWPVARLPIRVRAGDFLLPYEGQLTRVLAVKNIVVGGVPTTIRVGIDPLPRPVPATPTLPVYGPQLIDQANKVLASLQLSDAWNAGTRPGTDRSPPAYAWASSVRYLDTPFQDPPLRTIATLGPGDLIVWARLGARGSGGRGYARLPLDLREARHGRCCDSPPPERWIHAYEIFANAAGRSLIVRIYSRLPLSKGQRVMAQARLDLLAVEQRPTSPFGRLSWRG